MFFFSPDRHVKRNTRNLKIQEKKKDITYIYIYVYNLTEFVLLLFIFTISCSELSLIDTF